MFWSPRAYPNLVSCVTFSLLLLFTNMPDSDDASNAAPASNPSAPIHLKPPGSLTFGANKVESWWIFRRRWENYSLLSDLTSKVMPYQVALLENCLGDEAMSLYRGFRFATPDSDRTVTEILDAFASYAVGITNETYERLKTRGRGIL